MRRRPRDRLSDRSRAGAAALSQATHAAVIAAVIAGVVLSGCGGEGGDATGGASSTARTTTGASAQSGSASGLSPATRRELRQLDRKLKVVRTPPQQVRGVVNVVLELGRAATCGPPLVTSRYVKVAYGSRQGCVDATRSHAGIAHKLRFRSVRITGSTATAVVIPSGGLYDGERITVSLIRDPRWSVDRLRSNAPVGP